MSVPACAYKEEQFAPSHDAALPVCVRQTDRGGEGVVCVENVNVCLHHMLNVCVCGERGRVLTHCPGRDTATTAVLVIKQL